MINGHGGANATFKGRPAAMCRDKIRCRTNQLIYTDTLTRNGSRMDTFQICDAFVAPRSTMCFTICTSWTGWWVYRSKILGNEVAHLAIGFKVPKLKLPKHSWYVRRQKNLRRVAAMLSSSKD